MKLKYIFLTLTVLLACVLSGCGADQAKDPAEPVLRCYQELLRAAPALEGTHPELERADFDAGQNQAMFGNHLDQFAVVDLNGDGIPELIASTVINFRWVPVYVYTYADGKAVLLQDPQNPAQNGTFEQCSTASGAYTTYICAANHIHSTWRGNTPVGEMEENHAYVMDGTTLVPVDCTAGDGTDFFGIAKQNTAQNVDAMIAK